MSSLGTFVKKIGKQFFLRENLFYQKIRITLLKNYKVWLFKILNNLKKKKHKKFYLEYNFVSVRKHFYHNKIFQLSGKIYILLKKNFSFFLNFLKKEKIIIFFLIVLKA